MFMSVPYDPWTTDFEAIETVGDATLGGLYYDRGELYMFVKNNSADTDAILGYLAVQMAAGGKGGVTMKDAEAVDSTVGSATKPCGMWCYAIQFGNWGFIKVMGWSDNNDGDSVLVTAGSVAAGDPLVLAGGAGSLTFISEKMAAGQESACFGNAVAADVGTVVLAQVNFLP